MSLPTLVVETAHSRYVIDQDAGTYVRTRIHEDANDLSTWGVADGEPVPYSEVASDLLIGGRLFITHDDGTWIRSTEIQSVAEVGAE